MTCDVASPIRQKPFPSNRDRDGRDRLPNKRPQGAADVVERHSSIKSKSTSEMIAVGSVLAVGASYFAFRKVVIFAEVWGMKDSLAAAFFF